MKKTASLLSVLILLAGLSIGADEKSADEKGDKKEKSGKAESQAEQVDFSKEVWPILKENCFKCHGEEKQKADMRLDSQQRILDLHASGSGVLVPGKPDKSELYRRISLPPDHDDRMPAEGDPLGKPQQQTIKRWIEQGAGVGEIVFARDIFPIFKSNCIKCHGPEKQKGEFRMDSRQHLLEGGEVGDDIIPGNGFDSGVYFRVSLPPDDEDVMPPEDAGDPLSKEKQELIKKWIDRGAFFGGWEEAELGGKKIVLPEVAEADPDAVEKLRDLGALAMPLAKDVNLLTVDFRPEAKSIGDSHLVHLKPVKEQLAWLNLAETKITNAGLKHIDDFPHLRRLHLESTAIGDDGLKHLSGLESLRYLNLYGTKVSNAGLKHLEGLKNLQKLFLWKTNVQPETALEFERKLPDIDINMGWEYEKKLRRRQQASRGDRPLKPVVDMAKPDADAPKGLDPSGKSLTVAAWCKPKAGKGVLLEHGGESDGYALYLWQGKPVFAVRADGELKKVVGPDKLSMNQPAHLVGVLSEEKKLHLYVNGEQVAEADGQFIASNPSDNFAVGKGANSAVGEYDGTKPFNGELKDLKVYWGAATVEKIEAWAAEYGFELPEPAIKLTDPSESASKINPANTPLTIGAWAKPKKGDGVLLARGGGSLGYTLYLKGGKPHFAIRSDSKLKQVAADKKVQMNKPVHLVGLLDKDQKLHIFIDGEHAAKADGHFIASDPGDGFTAGEDSNPVAEYKDPNKFDGELKDLRVYLDGLSPRQIKQWAGQAAESGAGKKQAKADKAGEPINKKCPFTGDPIDSSKTVAYKGKTIAFCCGDCLAKFKKDPDKFIAKVDAFEQN